MSADRILARRLAAESISRGKPLDWFEDLYRLAGDNASSIPWADMAANPNLVNWLERAVIAGTERRALVVGCGLGDDAECLTRIGFCVMAFDISESCIAWCRRRFPESSVDYSAVDLFSSPPNWRGTFDLVVESYTLQVLPDELRPIAMQWIAKFVAPGGTLLVIARGRDAHDAPGAMPWPLVRSELAEFDEAGLLMVNFEDFLDGEDPPVRRFRVEYRRPA